MSSDTDCATTVGSLFSGIGGIDLGLERAGMVVIWQAEIDPYASRVLAEHWPDVPNLGDVKLIDWSGVERPDLICGGFPCQPFSTAGRRLGTADERWLWPEVGRCLRVLRPDHAVLENVPGILAGAGMGEVLGDLAEIGYDAEWQGVPAAAVGAPHLRWRVFFVAHAQGTGCKARSGDGLGTGPAPESGQLARPGCQGMADAHGPVGAPTRRAGQEVFRSGTLERSRRCGCCVGNHWESEPDVGRTLDGVPHKVDRLRCLGNAVVPQVAEYVGRRLLAHLAAEGPPTA